MRESARIESLNYGTIYALGGLVAGIVSYSQHTPVRQLVLHVACSWGYVVYWVLNLR